MKLTDQVCLLNQAKKLRELGITQDSLFYHFPDPNTEEVKKVRNLPDYNVVYGGEYIADDYLNLRTRVLMGKFNITYSAFTVAELNLMLGDWYTSFRAGEHENYKWIALPLVSEMNDGRTGLKTISSDLHLARYGDTQAEALACLLIACMEIGFVYFEDANKRLTDNIEQPI